MANHHGQLAKLKQESKVQDYIEEFRWLQTLVWGWSNDALLGAFLKGLKQWLARELKLKQPRRLQEAMNMAEILEESYYAEKRQGKEEVGGKASKQLHVKAPLEKEETEATTKGKKGVKKLTDEEVRERMKKGPCFKCGEKWGVGHKCATGQAFSLWMLVMMK